MTASSGQSGGQAAGSGWQYLAAGAESLGGLVTSAFNIHETRQNRRFAREMADTVHQREVNDLRLAGLNPILSAGGNGSPVPSVQAPQATNPVEGASAKMLMGLQAKNLQAQTDNTNADTSAKVLENAIGQSSMETTLLQRRLEYQNMIKDGNLKDAALQTARMALQKTEAEIEQLRLIRQHSALGLSEAEARSQYFRGPGKAMPLAGGYLSDLANAANAAKVIYEKAVQK